MRPCRHPTPILPVRVVSDIIDDPELRLLIAATARPARQGHRDVIAAAAVSGAIDWPRFLRLVERHRVAPLAFDAVAELRDAISAPVLSDLRAHAMRDRMQAMQSVHVLASVSAALAAAGVDAISIKGPVLAQLAFGDVTLRQSHDIDLLIAPDDVVTAIAALEAADCMVRPGVDAKDTARLKVLTRQMKDVSLVHRASVTLIELHWRLHPNPRLLPVASLPSRQTVQVGPFAARTFGTDDLMLYLSAHGAKHHWFRLKWLSDLYALLAPRPMEQLEGFYQRATEQGLAVPVGQTLRMLEAVYGLSLPDRVRRHTDRSWRVRLLTRRALGYLAMMQEPDEHWHASSVMALGTFGFRSDIGYVAREIAGQLVDKPTIFRTGGTRRGYALAILGRPFLLIGRRIAAILAARRRR